MFFGSSHSLAAYENATVTRVNVTNSGEGYTAQPPAVALSPPASTSGSQAKAEAVMARTGRILRLDLLEDIDVSKAGMTRKEERGTPRVYVTPPVGGGVGAEAKAVVKKGKVSR